MYFKTISELDQAEGFSPPEPPFAPTSKISFPTFLKAGLNRGRVLDQVTGIDCAPSGYRTKLAQAVITIADQTEPPRRFIAGEDAISTAEQVIAILQQQINAYRDLSTSLSFDEVRGRGNGN
jgi:hypothetical protein